MSKKRYKFGIIKGSRQAHIIDCHTCKSTTIDVYDDNIKYFVDKLNEQQATITKLKELNDDKGKRIISLIRTNKNLKEENEQLRKELDNFKPVMFQDVRKGTVILYSKD